MTAAVIRWAVLAVVWLCGPALAQPAFSVPAVELAGDGPVTLEGSLEMLRDPGRAMTLADIALSPVTVPPAAFAPVAGPVGLGFTTDALWVRVRLHRAEDGGGPWLLELEPPFLDRIDIYLAVTDTPASPADFRHWTMGAGQPFAGRPMPARTFLVPLDIPVGEQRVLYARVQSATAVILKGNAQTGATITLAASQTALWYGFLIGTLVLAAVFNLICFAWLRDVSYLIYGSYVILLMCGVMTVSGTLAEVFPQAAHHLAGYLRGVSITMGGVLADVFTVRVLGLRRSMPWLGWILLAMAAVKLVCAVLVLAGAYSLGVSVSQSLAILVAAATLYACVRLSWQGDVQARRFTIAFAPAVLGAAVAMLRTMGLLPSGWFTDQAYYIATLIHVVLMNVSMMIRIRDAEQDKRHAQAAALAAAHNAEARALRIVADQTRALVHAKAEVETALAAERQATRDQLQFIDMIAHEYRTPVSVMRTALDILEMRPDTSRQSLSGIVDKMRRAVDRLAEVIEVGLRRDRIDQPGLSADLVPVDLGTVLSDAVAERGDGAPVALVLPSGPLPVRADAALLRTAVLNLLDNAGKYGPAGAGIMVTAGCEGGRMLVRVTDAGPGIPPQARGRIFDKYYRTPAARSVPGVGLGLYLVTKIMALHAGGLELESGEPGACTFLMWLPAAGTSDI